MKVKSLISLILAFSILIGQTIKLSLGPITGLSVLDISTILLIFWGLFKSKLRFSKPPVIFLSVFLFLIIGQISLLFSPLHLNFSEYLISTSYTIRIGIYLIFGYFIYLNVYPNLNNSIPELLTFSGIGLAVLGILQFIFIPDLRFLAQYGWDPHYFRTVSTFLDPNFLGAYLVLTLVLIVQHYQRLTSLIPKYLVNAGFLACYLALATTFSRSAILMFGVCFLILFLVHRNRKFFLLCSGLSIGFGIAFLLYHQFITVPRNIDRTESAEYRITTWEQGLEIFQKAPILGTGFNSYRYSLSYYNLASSQQDLSHGGTSNDSSLLYVLDTTGIVGFLIYITLLFQIFSTGYKSYKKKNPLGLALLSGEAGLLVDSLFIDSLFFPVLILWIILTLCSLSQKE